MQDHICYIVGAGENYELDFLIRSGDYVIAADGGLIHLQNKGIMADLIIGDFDSLPQIPSHSNIINLDKDKDYTDTLAAIYEGRSKGYKLFYIYGGAGGRIDHTIANIQAVAFLSQNKMRGYLFDQSYVITAITNESICFNSSCSGYISIFSCSDKSKGVSIKGLKYKLENYVINNTFPIGVSNEFIGVNSMITVEDGTLIITFPRKCEEKIYYI